jgi:outer membrane protein assembly factor BamE (lipoprotein component of BamABCDE complex)
MARIPALKALSLAVALGVAGCAPTYSNHGFTPQLSALETVEAGLDTRSSVLTKLGRPSASSTFESDHWYYVASRMERRMFYKPKVIDRTVVAIRFDEDGLVDRVDRYGLEDGAVVALRTETTPTYGRELTLVQQLLSNVGRIDGSTLLNN